MKADGAADPMVAGGAADRAVEGEVVGWVVADGDGSKWPWHPSQRAEACRNASSLRGSPRNDVPFSLLGFDHLAPTTSAAINNDL